MPGLRVRPGGAGGRAAVAVAEQQVGGRPGKQGEPVGGEPVDEGGQEGVAAVDTGQDQQTAQAGLDEAEPARSDRDERDDVGGGVRQKLAPLRNRARASATAA